MLTPPPKRPPWPANAEPEIDVLADWLLSLSREQFEWVLARQRHNWAEDSRCFMLNHLTVVQGEGRVTHQAQVNISGAKTACGQQLEHYRLAPARPSCKRCRATYPDARGGS